jgi:hypothetical protein
VAIFTTQPAQAQAGFDISFDAFHDQLSSYGDWAYSDRWGEVWRPMQQDQDPNWRPYSAGHWAYTEEYGWTWISDEGPWSEIVYHYGRWVYDPDDGWLWLTGYVWSPAWVVWRSAGPNVGWMPMPPDDGFLGYGGPAISVNVNFGDWRDTSGFYGYSRWYGPRFDEARFGALWTFVPAAHVADPVYRTYIVPRPQVVNIVRVSQNITNYTVVNNVVVNKSVNVTMVQGAGARPVTPVRAATVLHTTRWIAPVTRGQQVQAQMRQVHPRGNGVANSAPPPTPAQIKTLSARAIPPHGTAGPQAPRHLFSQANVAQMPNGNRAGSAAPAVAPGGRPFEKPGAATPAPKAPIGPAQIPENGTGLPSKQSSPNPSLPSRADMGRNAPPQNESHRVAMPPDRSTKIENPRTAPDQNERANQGAPLRPQPGAQEMVAPRSAGPERSLPFREPPRPKVPSPSAVDRQQRGNPQGPLRAQPGPQETRSAPPAELARPIPTRQPPPPPKAPPHHEGAKPAPEREPHAKETKPPE